MTGGAGPLHVVHLGKFYPPASGGIEAHVATLARAQARLGAQVEVLCINHLSPDGRDVTDDAVAVTRTAEDWDGPVRIRRMGRVLSVKRMDVCPGLGAELWRLRRARPDVLHLHAPNPTITLGLAALPAIAPVVITHHSDVVRQRLLGAVFRPLELVSYGRAARVLATSDRYADASALLRRFREKVRALPLGIELGPFASPSPRALREEARLRAEQGGPLWLTVGRLVYYKGLGTALQALRALPGRLLVIGRGPVEAELKAEAARLGVADRVTWAGQVDDETVVGAYRAATALWFPSNARSEAFGLAQVEALASGCPVINTQLAGSAVPWVSLDGETGLTVPVGDAPALAAASRRLLDEPGLRERLGEAGRLRARADFDAAVMAQRSLDHYRAVLA